MGIAKVIQRTILTSRATLGMLVTVVLTVAPAFADSPPDVYTYKNVYTIGAQVSGGTGSNSIFGAYHRFAFWRDEDRTYTIWESEGDGLGAHNFTVPVTRPDQRHAFLAGQTCWYTLPLHAAHTCGPWSQWSSVLADERPGKPGELKGYGGNNGACADVWGFGTQSGSPVSHFNCTGADNQRWTYLADHGLRGFGSKCLTAWNSNGNQAGMFDCFDLAGQKWDFRNATIRGLNGNCADAPAGNTSNGTQAQMYYCNGTGAQVFNFFHSNRFGEDGEIRGPGNQCLDVFSFGTGNGTPVVFWNCNGLANQKWSVTANGEIRGWGNKCLEVKDFGVGNTSKLQMWDCHGGTNQKFWITGELRNVFDYCLDLPLNSPAGVPLQTWQCWGGLNQRWQYTP